MPSKHSIRLSLFAAACTALLSACTTQSLYTGDTLGGPAGTSRPDARRASSDPLLDAPNRALMTCTSEQPITVLQRFKEIPFACADLGVSATVDEMRDAGWRVVSLDIGEDIEADSHVGFPITIKVRKLF